MTDDELLHVTHRLRNQLNNITVNAELTKLQLQNQTQAEKVLTSVDRILHDCQQCSELLESLPRKQSQ